MSAFQSVQAPAAPRATAAGDRPRKRFRPQSTSVVVEARCPTRRDSLGCVQRHGSAPGAGRGATALVAATGSPQSGTEHRVPVVLSLTPGQTSGPHDADCPSGAMEGEEVKPWVAEDILFLRMAVPANSNSSLISAKQS